MNDLTKRLDGLAVVLTGTTEFGQYAHMVYEASVELALQAGEVAMLRSVAKAVYTNYERGVESSEDLYEELFAALYATKATAAEFVQQVRAEALESAAKHCDEIEERFGVERGHHQNVQKQAYFQGVERGASKCADAIRAIKGAKP